MQTLCFFDEASGDMGGADKRQGKRMRKGTEESEGQREERPFSFPMAHRDSTSIHTESTSRPNSAAAGLDRSLWSRKSVRLGGGGGGN